MSSTTGFAITIDDGEIRKHLRQLGEPITLFGEGPADRRNRLKELLSVHGHDLIDRKKEDEKEIVKVEKDQTETTWYHEGPESLKIARLWLAYYSLPRAKQRLSNVKLESEIPESTRTAKRSEICSVMKAHPN
jgi:U4/U6 small nuclear ribonucleoprotein PRP4